MALKPTIYKMKIALSDLNQDYYDSLALTVAQHPSETLERMMVRVLAFCLNAQENLQFTKGLSEVDEPDLWVKTLDDQIELWIDVGEPAADRIKKATRQAKQVKVYSFNTKSDVWWGQGQHKLTALPASYYLMPWDNIQTLASFVARTMQFSVTITGDSAFIATEQGECEIAWSILHEPS